MPQQLRKLVNANSGDLILQRGVVARHGHGEHVRRVFVSQDEGFPPVRHSQDHPPEFQHVVVLQLKFQHSLVRRQGFLGPAVTLRDFPQPVPVLRCHGRDLVSFKVPGKLPTFGAEAFGDKRAGLHRQGRGRKDVFAQVRPVKHVPSPGRQGFRLGFRHIHKAGGLFLFSCLRHESGAFFRVADRHIIALVVPAADDEEILVPGHRQPEGIRPADQGYGGQRREGMRVRAAAALHPGHVLRNQGTEGPLVQGRIPSFLPRGNRLILNILLYAIFHVLTRLCFSRAGGSLQAEREPEILRRGLAD